MTILSPDANSQRVADAIATCLMDAIEKRESASLVVCGGSSPLGIFSCLAAKTLPWEAVCITLADDRQVPAEDPHSNIRLVSEHLLINNAAAATFIPLQELDAEREMPFDVVLPAQSWLLRLTIGRAELPGYVKLRVRSCRGR